MGNTLGPPMLGQIIHQYGLNNGFPAKFMSKDFCPKLHAINMSLIFYLAYTIYFISTELRERKNSRHIGFSFSFSLEGGIWDGERTMLQ